MEFSFRQVSKIVKPEWESSKAIIRINYMMVTRFLQSLDEDDEEQYIDIPYYQESIPFTWNLNDFLLPHLTSQHVEEMLDSFSIYPGYRVPTVDKITSKLRHHVLAAVTGSTLSVEYEVGLLYYQIVERESPINESFEFARRVSTPALKSAVEELKRSNFQGSEFRDSMCIVCREDFSTGEETIEMPCSHVFHTNCLLTWFMENHTCPICRFELPKQHE